MSVIFSFLSMKNRPPFWFRPCTSLTGFTDWRSPGAVIAEGERSSRVLRGDLTIISQIEGSIMSVETSTDGDVEYMEDWQEASPGLLPESPSNHDLIIVQMFLPCKIY